MTTLELCDHSWEVLHRLRPDFTPMHYRECPLCGAAEFASIADMLLESDDQLLEWDEWEAGDAYKMSHTSLAREWDDMPDDWGLDLVE